MALYELKPGNGGHGLEPFNTKTGKYEKITMSFEGIDISGWEDLRDSMLDDSQKEIYKNADQSTKDAIDNVAKEAYEQLLTDEVDILNRTRQFESPSECVDNIGDFLNKDIVDDVLGNLGKDYFENIYVKEFVADPSTIFTVERIPYLIQNIRYRQLKMNKMSEADFNNEISNIATFTNDTGDSKEYCIDFLAKNDRVPIYRGIEISAGDSQRVHQGYVEDGPNLSKSLLGSGNYDSVIYMTMQETYSDGYNGGLKIKGMANVRNKKIKILEAKDYSGSSDDEVRELRSRLPQIQSNVVSACLNMGYSSSDADKMAEVFSKQVSKDYGFCCMLLGYDAVCAEGHQLDILNPAMVDLVY